MVVGYKELGKINQTLSSILLRRTKREVLSELPERLEKNFFVNMTREQLKHHEENAETVARIVAKWRRFKFLSETDQRILMIALQNMRMSCNSTYLLDRITDYGHKCDELMELLHDLLGDPDAKAVVFSQWLGTHELIVRRLDGNGWGYAYLHCGVPSSKRKDLVKRFREDPHCRLFLSTEAGGVGMNLQCASAVINMDLPWNPAVLEQRIGRVHRLGQRRPVRVVNFVASGTIEHGMLSLLGFKKSFFAGVLDGGQDEVFLGGSRLKRFMESVERATTSIPQVPPPASPSLPQPRQCWKKLRRRSRRRLKKRSKRSPLPSSRNMPSPNSSLPVLRSLTNLGKQSKRVLKEHWQQSGADNPLRSTSFNRLLRKTTPAEHT
jgi:SNF2 family DNA or RNA helicase